MTVPILIALVIGGYFLGRLVQWIRDVRDAMHTPSNGRNEWR